MTMLDSALAAAKRGFLVFPIKPGEKFPPLIQDWPKLATSDEATIRKWWKQWPEANVGIHTAGMCVVDIDVKKGGEDAYFDWLVENGGAPRTLEVRTPSGGRHLYFSAPSAVRNGVDVLGRGVDIRGDGGYVVAAGSHTAAGAYAGDYERTTIWPAPDSLLAAAGRRAERQPLRVLSTANDEPALAIASELLERHEPVAEGGRNITLFKFSALLREHGLSQEHVGQFAHALNQEKLTPPLGLEEVDRTVASAFKTATQPQGQSSPAVMFDPVPVEPVRTSSYKPMAENPDEIDVDAHEGTLVTGMLNLGEASMLIGPPGAGKSYLALGLAYALATGEKWLGQGVLADDTFGVGATLYVAAERSKEQVKRWRAWCAADKQDKLPMRIIRRPISLTTGKEDAQRLVNEIEYWNTALGVPVRFVVVDTIFACLPGQDVNQAEIATAFMRTLAMVAERTGVHCMAIHHSPKDGRKSALGSQGFTATVDTILYVESKHKGRSGFVETIKCNTIAGGLEAVAFEREMVEEIGHARVYRYKQGSNVAEVSDFEAPTGPAAGLMACAPARSEDELRDKFYATLPADMKPDARRKSFQRALASLLESEHLVRIGAGFEPGGP